MSGIFYFGYGAMVNPVSRKRRGVETVSEKPAVLEDYRLTFALGGAGNVLRQRGWSVHGVVMECKSCEDWEKLKSFDSGYDFIKVDVYPYGSDDPISANVFVMEFNEEENAKLPLDRLPQERYIKIIAQGMRFHGVDDEYIDYQIMNVPYIPNRTPDEYLQFESSRKKLPKISLEAYRKKSLSNQWFRVGNRVIQIMVEHDPAKPFSQMVRAKLVGKDDCTWTSLQTLYDPDLPVCETPDQIRPLHQRWAENQLVDFFSQANVPARAVHVLKDVKQKKKKRCWFFQKRSKSTESSSSTTYEKMESTSTTNTSPVVEND